VLRSFGNITDGGIAVDPFGLNLYMPSLVGVPFG
jgi:hypothetical protein